LNASCSSLYKEEEASKAMVADEHGTQLLRLAETYQPLIRSHDVRVEICAASINPVEKICISP